jgi:hypothetical protein
MAQRTIQEIYNAMVAEKQSYTELESLQPAIDNSQQLLSDLNSKSKVAVWRLFLFVVAVSQWVLEGLFYSHRAEIDAIIAQNQYGTGNWYNQRALAFQVGDALTVVNGKILYETIDLSKRIVKYSATVPGNIIQIKIAGESGGNLTKITNTSPDYQLNQIQAYFNQIKPLGTRVSVTSNDADTLKIVATIYYDPLLIKSDGSLISDSSKRPVDIAINTYLKGIGFNGKLNIQKLTDAIQAVDGVIDVDELTVWAKYGETSYAQVSREYFSYAGWMVIDTSFALSTTVTYTPQTY